MKLLADLTIQFTYLTLLLAKSIFILTVQAQWFQYIYIYIYIYRYIYISSISFERGGEDGSLISYYRSVGGYVIDLCTIYDQEIHKKSSLNSF